MWSGGSDPVRRCDRLQGSQGDGGEARRMGGDLGDRRARPHGGPIRQGDGHARRRRRCARREARARQVTRCRDRSQRAGRRRRGRDAKTDPRRPRCARYGRVTEGIRTGLRHAAAARHDGAGRPAARQDVAADLQHGSQAHHRARLHRRNASGSGRGAGLRRQRSRLRPLLLGQSGEHQRHLRTHGGWQGRRPHRCEHAMTGWMTRSTAMNRTTLAFLSIAASLLALSAAVVVSAQQAGAPQASSERVIYLNQGWSQDDREWYYHFSQGSAFLSYDIYLNLELAGSQELLRSGANYGLLPGPVSSYNPDGLPIGISKTTVATPIKGWPAGDYAGVTCAACHEGELTYKGKRIRIQGGNSRTIDLQ